MMDLLLILGYLVCSILAYGMSLAYWQREFQVLAKRSWGKDCFVSIPFSLFGPLSFVLVFFLSAGAKHGLMYRRES